MRTHIVKPFFYDRIRRASGSGLPKWSHCCSPCRRNGSAPFGDAPGGTPRVPGALNGASILLSGSVVRRFAGPVTMMPNSGGAAFREAGPIFVDGAAVRGEPSSFTVTRLARVPRRPLRAARVSGCSAVSQARDRTAQIPAERLRCIGAVTLALTNYQVYG